MKDTSDKELKITEERVKAAAEKCETAKEILKELFPDVFKVAPPEWEDVTLRGEVRPGTRGFPVYIISPEKANFQIKFHDNDDCFVYPAEKKKDFKIENGRIWRKRERQEA